MKKIPRNDTRHDPISFSPTMYWATTPDELRAIAEAMENDVHDGDFDDRNATYVTKTYSTPTTHLAICIDTARVFSADGKMRSKRSFQAHSRNGHMTTRTSPNRCSLCDKPITHWGKTCAGMPTRTRTRNLFR